MIIYINHIPQYKSNPVDVRVSLVSIAAGGKVKLDKALDRMNLHLDEKLRNMKKNKIQDFHNLSKKSEIIFCGSN